MTDTQAQEAAMPVIAYLRASKDGMPKWTEDCVCEDPVYPSDPDGSDEDCISMPMVRKADADVVIASQAARIAELERERDEADRRAGAAERNAEYLRDGAVKRASWLHEAKQQWGADPNVSFDVVWAEALSARAELARMREPLSDGVDESGAPRPGYLIRRINVGNLKAIYRNGSATPMLAALGNCINAIEDAQTVLGITKTGGAHD